MEKYYTFKDQSLENRLSCYSSGNILLVINLEQKQQTTKFKEKETDPVRNQICSSYYNMKTVKSAVKIKFRTEIKNGSGCYFR